MKTGWILEDTFADSLSFVAKNLDTIRNIRNANVFTTRGQARKSNKLDTDVVRKVKLDKQGKAVKIIPGR